MAHRDFKLRRRRTGKRKTWLYVLFVLLLIMTLKMRTHTFDFNPTTIFGESTPEFTHEFAPAPSDAQEDVEAIAPQLKLIPESNRRQLSQSLAKPIEKPEAKPPAQDSAPSWEIPQAPRPARRHSRESDAIAAEVASSLNANPPRVIEARDKLCRMLAGSMNRQQTAFAKKMLSELADQWLFAKAVCPQDEICSNYKVKPGDNLAAIGKKHKVPYQILMKINNITNPRSLRAGETIKVINGPFHVMISRSTFTMDLYVRSTFVRSFEVGLGRDGHETPTGRWSVKRGGKLISPLWTDPDTGRIYQAEDPDYPLGSRWIALKGIEGDAQGKSGFAIHGTKRIEDIGTASSRGCIRMKDEEVLMVYDLLTPGSSEVVIFD